MPLYCAEIIPAIGMGAATALQWLAAFGVGYLVPQLEDYIDVQVFIYFFIACNIIAYIFTIVTCIETKGLTEAEIVEKYEAKIRKKDNKKKGDEYAQQR